jgi:hypothetical protein
MRKFSVEISDEAFHRLGRHALSKDTTTEKLASQILCGAYCAAEHDDPDLYGYIDHAWVHADPDMLDTDEGVRAYYDMYLDND